MKIISRYLYKEFFTFFSISLITFLFIYLVIEFFGKIDNFLEAHVPLKVVFLFFLYKIPFVVQQMIPVSVLISVMITIGIMNKHNEILAIKNCGISLFRLFFPYVVIATVIGVASFFLSESIVPITSSVANTIWKTRVGKGHSQGAYKLSHLWYRGKDSIYQIRLYDSKKKTIEGLTIFFFDNTFTLRKRIDARKARWSEGMWHLNEGLIQKIAPDGSRKTVKFQDYTLLVPETPQVFERTMRAPEEMSFWALRNYIKKIREEGYDATRSQVELQAKIASPFISLVLTLIGIPLGLRKRKGGIPFGITIGIGISFLYLMTFGLSRSLALSGILPSVLGAWLANLLFLFFGMYLLLAEER